MNLLSAMPNWVARYKTKSCIVFPDSSETLSLVKIVKSASIAPMSRSRNIALLCSVFPNASPIVFDDLCLMPGGRHATLSTPQLITSRDDAAFAIALALVRSISRIALSIVLATVVLAVSGSASGSYLFTRIFAVSKRRGHRQT